MATRLQPVDELDQLRDRSAAELTAAIESYARRLLRREDVTAAFRRIERLLGRTLGLSDLLGRRRVLLLADNVPKTKGARTMLFSASPSPLATYQSFEDAIRDLVSRDPRLAKGYEEVQRLYASEHVFALAKSNTDRLTRTVQKRLADVLARGGGLAEAERVIADLGNWSRAYAETVYRTNLATAYSSGIVAQTMDPAVDDVFPAWEYDGVKDGATRHNHAAAFGLIASKRDPIWTSFAPPLGYSCRCVLSPVSRFELAERGLIRGNAVVRYEPPGFADAHPDPGFGGGRPSLVRSVGRTSPTAS